MTVISVLWHRLRVVLGHLPLAVKLVRQMVILLAQVAAPMDPHRGAAAARGGRAELITVSAMAHPRSHADPCRIVRGVLHVVEMAAMM